MLKRNEKGKLVLQSLDVEIFLGDLFAECKSETEIYWLRDELVGMAELIADERYEELEID